jgi:hypothetical protein
LEEILTVKFFLKGKKKVGRLETLVVPAGTAIEGHSINIADIAPHHVILNV